MESLVEITPNPSFWRDKKVLITGHTGFKGSWLVQILKKYECQILGLGLPPKTNESIYNSCSVKSFLSNKSFSIGEYVDITDSQDVRSIINNFSPDIIFHLAAQPLVFEGYKNPINTYNVNVLGTANILNAVVQSDFPCRATLVITTDKVYHNEEQLWSYRENDRLGGTDPYSASKTCAEFLTRSYYLSFLESKGVGVATARAGNVIGGGDWSQDRILPDIVRCVSSGSQINLRNPNSTRPWQHVLESLSGYIRLAECLYNEPEKNSQAYNFGPNTDHFLTVDELTRTALECFSADNPVEYVVSDLHEAAKLSLDSTKARELLGWHPKWNATEAIRRTCEWYKVFISGQGVLDFTDEQIKDYFAN